MFSKLGKLYNGMERTYRGIIMIVVIVIMVGVGYAGYVVYQKGSGMFNFFSGLVKDSYGRGAGIPLVCVQRRTKWSALLPQMQSRIRWGWPGLLANLSCWIPKRRCLLCQTGAVWTWCWLCTMGRREVQKRKRAM